MHELSITRNVVAIVSEHAGGKRVKRVKLQIGRLSAIMPDAIRFCFGICSEGTPLVGATLEIEEIPGLGRCDDCHAQVTLTALVGRCPRCGGNGLKLLSGEEMKIKEFEFDVEGLPCA